MKNLIRNLGLCSIGFFLAVLLFWAAILGGSARAEDGGTAGTSAHIQMVTPTTKSNTDLGLRTNIKFSRLGEILTVQNVGVNPIRITGIKINDRDDCQANLMTGPFMYAVLSIPFPNADINKHIEEPGGTLKVGDILVFMPSCPVVRATIVTDQGSQTFYWGG